MKNTYIAHRSDFKMDTRTFKCPLLYITMTEFKF